MSSFLNSRRDQLLVIIIGILLIIAFSVAQVAPETQVVEVTQVIPVTLVALQTQIVEVTEVIPVTQIVPSTQVVEVTRIVSVTPTSEAPDDSPNLKTGIYFTVGVDLLRMDQDGGNFEIVANGLDVTEHLAVDGTQNKIYMSRWGQPGQILVFDLQNGDIKPISDGPQSGGQGMAIDSATSKLYLGSYFNGLYVTELNDIGSWQQIVSSELLSPLLGQRGQLQIDSVQQTIYFRSAFDGPCDSCRYIWRVDSDGNNLTKVIPANGGDALALDLTDSKLYYSDEPGNGTVRRANLDGSEVETLFTVPAPYRFCKGIVLDSINKKLYLSLYDVDSDNGRAIARMNMDGTEFEILYEITGTLEEEEGVSGGIALFLP